MDYPLSDKEGFSLYIALSDMTEDGLLFEYSCNGNAVMTAKRDGSLTAVTLYTDQASFTLNARNAKGSLALEYDGANLSLYADDALADEEWPLGALPHGEWTETHSEGIPYWECTEYKARAPQPLPPVSCMQFYNPESPNAHIGDCMPFADGDTLHLFALLDRNGHRSKCGLGAHRWGHYSTKDGRNWTSHPVAIGIDGQWEGSICTGSLIRIKDKIYAYYAVRMADRSPAHITWAVSTDGVRFEKSGIFYTLNAPYDAVAARDPFVFRDESGLWHMLISTTMNGEGAIAHMTGSDPEHLEQADEPFLVPGMDGTPECCDLFRLGSLYYLVFSINGTAHYCMSESMTGPWRMPAENRLCGEGIRVAKTANLHGTLYAAGFTDGSRYGGQVVLLTLSARSDGTLAASFPLQVLPPLDPMPVPDTVSLDAPQGRMASVLCTPSQGYTLIRMHPHRETGCIGLRQEGSFTYRIDADGNMRWQSARRAETVAHVPEELTLLCGNGVFCLIADGYAMTCECSDAPIEVYALWGKGLFTESTASHA